VIARHLRSVCAAVAQCLCGTFAAFLQRLHSGCAPISKRLQCIYSAIAIRLRLNCGSTAMGMSSICAAFLRVSAAIAQQLRSNCAQRLQSFCTVISNRLSSDFKAFTQRFHIDCDTRNDCDSIVIQLWRGFATIVKRMRGVCAAFARRFCLADWFAILLQSLYNRISLVLRSFVTALHSFRTRLAITLLSCCIRVALFLRSF
jgi:hypothetical protein